MQKELAVKMPHIKSLYSMIKLAFCFN